MPKASPLCAHFFSPGRGSQPTSRPLSPVFDLFPPSTNCPRLWETHLPRTGFPKEGVPLGNWVFIRSRWQGPEFFRSGPPIFPAPAKSFVSGAQPNPTVILRTEPLVPTLAVNPATATHQIFRPTPPWPAWPPQSPPCRGTEVSPGPLGGNGFPPHPLETLPVNAWPHFRRKFSTGPCLQVGTNVFPPFLGKHPWPRPADRQWRIPVSPPPPPRFFPMPNKLLSQANPGPMPPLLPNLGCAFRPPPVENRYPGLSSPFFTGARVFHVV